MTELGREKAIQIRAEIMSFIEEFHPLIEVVVKDTTPNLCEQCGRTAVAPGQVICDSCQETNAGIERLEHALH